MLLSKARKILEEEKRLSLANTFEAIIGGMYLDSGYNSCKEFIHAHLIEETLLIL